MPVYFTVAPVCASHGATIEWKAFSSSPPHVPMTVTDWPVRSPPPDDGAALPPPVLGAGAEAPPPVLAAGLGVAVPDEQAAANSVTPAMSAAILDRR